MQHWPQHHPQACAICGRWLDASAVATARGPAHHACAFPRPSLARQLATIGAVGLGAVVLLVALIVTSKTTKGSKAEAAPDSPRTPASWGGELAGYLRGDLMGHPDPSCKKWKCSRHDTSVGSAMRMMKLGNFKSAKLLVERRLEPRDVGRVWRKDCAGLGLSGIDAATRRQYYQMIDGPLEGRFLVTDPRQTHILTAEYLVDPDNGFSATEIACLAK